MRMKILLGAAVLAFALGLGVLIGNAAGAGGVSAQTPSQTPTPSAQPSATTSTAPSSKPGRGGHGGRWGFGWKGAGHKGWGAATAEGASSIISGTTNLISITKDDLTYATGKMDTADVQRWLNGADSLLQRAQSANANAQYGQAVAYAQAAGQLAMIARMRMAQELGVENLPSYNQLPAHGHLHGVLPAKANVTQAQASYILSQTYYRLRMQSAVVSGDGRTWLTEAQNAYRSAYDAYQAGNYGEAVTYAHLADRLAGVAGSVSRAPDAPANRDTPVTVPVPNF
jgi:O6-methylguanine-DNA--protein-cysteine methyltransferase